METGTPSRLEHRLSDETLNRGPDSLWSLKIPWHSSQDADHYLSQCPDIVRRPPEEVEKWIADGKRCRKCGRTNHEQDACTLKKACSECQEVHLRVLHTIAKPGPRVYLITPEDRASLANSKQGGKVYLKVVPIVISHGSKSLHTYAILDDGAERTIILPAAVRHLELKGGPAAVHTALSWVLQGPDGLGSHAASCYFTSLKPAPDDYYQHVKRLWQLDVLLFRSEKLAVRSRLDQEAMSILEACTERVKVIDTFRYATPLLRAKDAPLLKAAAEAVMPMLCSTE
ncbi:hypothetical protein N1851_008173 [Merluccius polli]|uniref:Peptidase A2 domain-containing protein n=1 Tax=Merluccius polli TaxID=89951 RepID=A0AA47N1J7_MERPO|nr:hypothetical protein N1851_008173 [Merluccius polli]